MDNQLAGAIISAILGYGIAIVAWSYLTGNSFEDGAIACFFGFIGALVIQMFLAYRGMNKRAAMRASRILSNRTRSARRTIVHSARALLVSVISRA